MTTTYTIQGTGQLEKRGPRKWRIRVSLGYDPEQEKYVRSPSRTIEGTKADAIEALIAYKEELRSGVDPKKTKTKIKEYAWTFHVSRKNEFNSPLAFDREKYEIRDIIKFFGEFYVSELDTHQIRKTYADIRENRLLSENALFKMHQKLTQMMKFAIWDRLTDRNPCDPIRMIKPDSEERESLTIKEAIRLDRIIFTTAITAMMCVVMLALHTGLRRGEILGLTWKRIDFEHNCMFILYQYAKDKELRKTKSKKKLEGRWVSFDEKARTYLLLWKKIQARLFEEYNEECMAKFHSYGPNGKLVQTEDTPVITNKHGGYQDPDCFNRWFRNFCVKHRFGKFTEETKKRDGKGVMRTYKRGYEGLCLHMLRHTQSSLLSEEDVDLLTIMNRLGHKDLRTTLGYTHRPKQDDIEASNLMGEILSSGESREDQLSVLYPDLLEELQLAA